VVDLLNPVALDLVLTSPPSRLWHGGPSQNCWRLYNTGTGGYWELVGGNGLVVYHMSGTFTCDGPNVFDILIVDQTGQAPASITIWPFSPAPCLCNAVLQPTPNVLALAIFRPKISEPPVIEFFAEFMPLDFFSPYWW